MRPNPVTATIATSQGLVQPGSSSARTNAVVVATQVCPETQPRSPWMPSRSFTSSPSTPSGRSLPPSGLAAFAPYQAAVPAASTVIARRLRPARYATAATAGTVPNVPACMIVRTGSCSRSSAPFAQRNTRSS